LDTSKFSQDGWASYCTPHKSRIIKGDLRVAFMIYDGEDPIAWCSVAPREQYGSLNRSHVLKRLDDTPVWSLVCLFVAKEYRNQGITRSIIKLAIDYVRSQGGSVIEAYPTLPKDNRLAPVSSFMGLPMMFEKAGFVEYLPKFHTKPNKTTSDVVI
jgi:GNAT superfamily N-acetyltransferase